MTNMDPRAGLQETLESLSKFQSGDAKLQALKAAIPHIPDSTAEAIIKIMSAEVQKTGTDQTTTAPSTAGMLSPTTQRLIEALKDKDSEVRWYAAWMLGKIKDPQAVPALLDALKDKNSEVRLNAVWALGEIKDPQAVPALLNALKDKNSEVREAAAFALEPIKDPRVVPALTQALKDLDSEVRMAALMALSKLRFSWPLKPPRR